MAIFVQDDFRVLRVVHAAGAEGQSLVYRALGRVVLGAGIDIDFDRPAEHIVEAETFDIALDAIYMEIDHNLLESRLAAFELKFLIALLDPLGGVTSADKIAVEKSRVIQKR